MKKINTNLIVLVIFMIAGTIFFLYDGFKSKKYSNTLKKEYPTIGFEERIYARITKIYLLDPHISRNDPHQVYLVLDHSIKKDICASFELTQRLTIDEVIAVGDRILKEANTNKFCLYKVDSQSDTLKYYFELEYGQGYPIQNNKNQ